MAYNANEGDAPPSYAVMEMQEGQQIDAGEDRPMIIAGSGNAVIPIHPEIQNIGEAEMAQIQNSFNNALCVRCGRRLSAKKGLFIGFFWLILTAISSVIESLFHTSPAEQQSAEKHEGGEPESSESDGFSLRYLRVLRLLLPLCCIVTAIIGSIGLRTTNRRKLLFTQKGLMIIFFFEIVDIVFSLIDGPQTNVVGVLIDIFSIVILSRMMQTNKLLIHILNALNN